MSWDRIRGHDDARHRLLAAYRQGRLGHAYLFVGPDGIGKRRFAVEFAKALLCEAPLGELSACDRCPACAQVEAVTHPDFALVRKPDDKLELPVELMREVCGNLALRPVRGQRRVTIIEDADDFNEESANCFLKTLEEPPPGSVLILIATSTDRQLPTVLSRCQVIRFSPLSSADLKLVLLDHGVTDTAVLDRSVRLSHGSVGQALAFAQGGLGEIRHSLLGALAVPRPDPVAFAGHLNRFIEEAGKDGAEQRPRAALAIRILAVLFSDALRMSLGSEPIGCEESERDKIRAISASGADVLTEKLEACVEATNQVERRVQLVLVVEQLADRVCRR
jgi:DNA polymerase-3 subunit delta'